MPIYEKKNWEFYLRSSVNVVPTFNATVEHCSVSPEITIPGMYFDESNGAFKGIVNEIGEQTNYTVTCTNGLGSSSTTLNFTYIDAAVDDVCSLQGNVYIRVIVKTLEYPERMQFTIQTEQLYQIISIKGSEEGWLKNSEYIYTRCVAPRDFRVYSYSTSYSGWKGQSVAVKIQSATIGNYSVDSTNRQKVDYINCINDYNI